MDNSSQTYNFFLQGLLVNKPISVALKDMNLTTRNWNIFLFDAWGQDGGKTLLNHVSKVGAIMIEFISTLNVILYIPDIKCSMPPIRINNGIRTNVLGTPIIPGSVARYRCHDGYAISYGNHYLNTLDITCTKNARRLGSEWNPVPHQVTCKGLLFR